MPTVEKDSGQAECGQGLLAKGSVWLGRWSRGGALGHGPGRDRPWSHQQYSWAQGSSLALVVRSTGRGMIACSCSRRCSNAYQPGLHAEVLKHSQDESWFLLAMQEVLTND